MEREPIDIAYVAALAHIALSDDERVRFGAQLGALFEAVETLARLPLDEIPASASVIDFDAEPREDVVVRSLDRETFLAGAPAREGPYVRVPRIIAEA
ncbi:MAG: Asp-tRNA(Asn)/Glu-tRNA(Gln) amidotransferase subunit GatC [Vulcanimicrobiaceae bacterium]